MNKKVRRHYILGKETTQLLDRLTAQSIWSAGQLIEAGIYLLSQQPMQSRDLAVITTQSDSWPSIARQLPTELIRAKR